MTTLYDVPADALIDALAERLADELEEPEWLTYAKSGESRELPPEQEDFWARRGASILRKLATSGPAGVERLSTEYGDAKSGSNRYRVAPNHRADGSKNVIRTLLQQLEELDYVEQAGKRGRTLSPDGRSLMDSVAGEVMESLDRPDLERYA